MPTLRKAADRGHADYVWLQMGKGDLVVKGIEEIHASDGLAAENEGLLEVEARSKAEFLLVFDLP